MIEPGQELIIIPGRTQAKWDPDPGTGSTTNAPCAAIVRHVAAVLDTCHGCHEGSVTDGRNIHMSQHFLIRAHSIFRQNMWFLPGSKQPRLSVVWWSLVFCWEVAPGAWLTTDFIFCGLSREYSSASDDPGDWLLDSRPSNIWRCLFLRSLTKQIILTRTRRLIRNSQLASAQNWSFRIKLIRAKYWACNSISNRRQMKYMSLPVFRWEIWFGMYIFKFHILSALMVVQSSLLTSLDMETFFG